MLLSLRITLLVSLLAVMVLPVLLESGHHHDGLAAHAATCNSDCGCVCHGGSVAILAADGPACDARVSLTVDSYHAVPPTADPAAVDHPPEAASTIV